MAEDIFVIFLRTVGQVLVGHLDWLGLVLLSAFVLDVWRGFANV